MRDAYALIAAVDQETGVATVTVRGEFGPSAYSRLQADLLWVAANCPRRLVLDLGVSNRFTEQLVTVIAAAQRQLPAGCLLEIRSASSSARHLLELAGWPARGSLLPRQQAGLDGRVARDGSDGGRESAGTVARLGREGRGLAR